MHYVAIVEGEEREVEVTETAPGKYRVHMKNRDYNCDVQAVSDSTLSMLMDNYNYNIEVERHPESGENLLVRGNVVRVEVLDLRKVRLRRAQEAAGGPAGPATIKSPMPGKIVAVLAKEGDEVKKGQGVVVVEAMKMENELKAPRDGVVRNMKATEGASVDGGAPLCTIE